jgi:hypothetical protein
MLSPSFVRSGAGLVVLLVAVACARSESTGTRTPTVVLDTAAYVDPPAVGTFPTTKAVINGWIAANDTVAIRRHAWDIWAALTAPSGYDGLPVWETFYSGHEIFELDTADAPDPLRHVRDFEIPRQDVHVDRINTARGIPIDRAERRTSFNRFSQSTAHYIVSHRLNLAATLDSINNAFNASNTPVAERQVFVSPPDSIDPQSLVLKVVFQFISGDSVAAVPYWMGYDPLHATNDTLPVADTWRQGVAVDPTGKLPLGSSIVMRVNNEPPRALKVVHLKSFYWIRLTQADVDHFSTFVRPQTDDIGAGNRTDSASLMQMVKPGNIALLMAMHVTGKEIPNWTWQTFWWSPFPQDPHFGIDRPTTIPAPWNNYNMNFAYTMVNADGSPRVAFNPYLETNLNGNFPTSSGPKWFGVQTNCMTCHRLAARGTTPGTGGFAPVAPYGPAQNIDPGDSTLFAGLTKIDFLWSVTFRAWAPKPPSTVAREGR